MIRDFEYPEKREELEKFLNENPVNHIWDMGGNPRVMRVYTGDDIPNPEGE